MELKAAGTFQIILFLIISCQYCNSFALPGADILPSNPISKGSLQSTDSTKRPCPEGSAFDNVTTKTCHKLYEKGPCGDLQVFYPQSRDSDCYGACACVTNDGCNQVVKSNRLILPGPEGKECFWAYSSGPCSDGQWYVLNMKSLKPECQKNPCASGDNGLEKPGDPLKGTTEVVLGIGQGGTDKFTFVLNNTCYDTNTRAFCTEGQYVQFLGTNDPNPKCYMVTMGPPTPFCISGFGPIAGMPCEAGYKLVGEDCVMANIDFE